MNIVVALHVCVRLSVASRLSHSYRMELFVNPRKKSHGRTSPGEKKQYHNYGKASPSMVDLPPPPIHTFLDKGTNTMADCPPGNYTIWQTFPMKEYLMANLPPEEIP